MNLLKKMFEKILYCIGGGDIWDLPEFNFISICSEKMTPCSYDFKTADF